VKIPFINKDIKNVYLSILVLLFMFIMLGCLFYYLFLKPPVGNASVMVTIEPDANMSSIASMLVEKHIIKNAFVFKMVAKYKGVSKIAPGNYALKEGMSASDAINCLTSEPIINEYPVTIPEGFSIKQIADRLGSKTKIDGAEFLNQAQNDAHNKDFQKYGFLSKNPTQTLEGYLFPKTYTLTENTSSTKFIMMMLDQYEKETAGIDFSSIEKVRGLTSHEVLTIASLIEMEAKIDEERPLVSAVIYNRLSKNMKLQICATVQHVLPERKAKLTTEDLKVDSPYNTYLHTGLPPGPICNPGIASIQAAVNPAAVDYLYYVLTSPDGRHTFTNNYKDFVEAKKKANNN